MFLRTPEWVIRISPVLEPAGQRYVLMITSIWPTNPSLCPSQDRWREIDHTLWL